MLAIGRAMVEERRLLIVDEPTKGLAPAVIGQLIEAFQELKRQRTTILLVEQNFAMARSLGDEVAVMDDGRIVHTGRDGGSRRRRGAAGRVARARAGGAPVRARRSERLGVSGLGAVAGRAGAGRGGAGGDAVRDVDHADRGRRGAWA